MPLLVVICPRCDSIRFCGSRSQHRKASSAPTRKRIMPKRETLREQNEMRQEDEYYAPVLWPTLKKPRDISSILVRTFRYHSATRMPRNSSVMNDGGPLERKTIVRQSQGRWARARKDGRHWDAECFKTRVYYRELIRVCAWADDDSLLLSWLLPYVCAITREIV